MSASKIDAVYRSFLITKFFTKGWGKPENLRRLFEFRKVVSNREECMKLVERDYPVIITKEQTLSDCRVLEGYFMSPLERYLPGIVPEVAKKAHFQAVIPLSWQSADCKPMCLHLAGTGDHFFWRRRNLMVRPLLKEAGIGGIILENPFYGLRKPFDQVRSSLHNVSDIFVMGGCLILESLVLFHWCERNGFGPLGVTGLSMGGHMASLAATNWPKPLVLVPCLSWSTASAVFLQGVMSQSINWDLLEDQYQSDGIYREKLSKMVTVIDAAFLAGKKFAISMAHKMADKENKMASIAKSDNSGDKVLDVKDKDIKVAKENTVPESKVIETNLQIDTFREELKRLLDDDKISITLYEKLSTNEKFELEAKDIEELNLLNEDNIKARVAMKFKINNFEQNRAYSINATTTPSDDSKDNKALGDTTDLFINKDDNVPKLDPLTPKPVDVDLKNGKIDVDQVVENKLLKEEIKKKPWNVSNFTTDLWMNLPFMRPKLQKKIDINKIHWRDREALQFMRGIMDECTHLSNFSIPYDTSLIIAVCAKHDAYVPRDDVGRLEEIWPGAEVRYLNAGHVTAYVLHQRLFRACIIEAFERSKSKWKDGKHVE